MKTYPFILRIFLLLLSSSCLFISCSEEPPLPDTVSYFPEFTLDAYVTHELGTPYEDGSVKATENGTEISFTTSGTVDTSTFGVYTLTYTATNSEGLIAKAFRYVLVNTKATLDTLKNRDISGNFKRSDRSERKMRLTKIANTSGFYEAFNVLGNTSDATAIVAQVNDSTLIIPLQDVVAAGGFLNGSTITNVIADEFNDSDTFGRIITRDTVISGIDIKKNSVQWHVKADDNNTARFPTGRRLRRWVFVRDN